MYSKQCRHMYMWKRLFNLRIPLMTRSSFLVSQDPIASHVNKTWFLLEAPEQLIVLHDVIMGSVLEFDSFRDGADKTANGM